MASVSSLMNSSNSTSSIYGNSNIISGLASGMDTESMIENAVSGIKNKLAGFNRDMTMLEWEQSAYRSIIDRMVNFSNKYFSFSSSTNLLSTAFFDSATKVSTVGKYSNLISATGTPSSTVRIKEVKQLATAATYTHTAAIAGGLTGQALNLSGEVNFSNITGSMTLGYGDKTYTLEFGEADVYKTKAELVSGINSKLKDAGLEGKVEAIESQAGTGIHFTIVDPDKTDESTLKITAASGDLAEKLRIQAGDANINDQLFLVDESSLYGTKTNKENLIGQEFTFTVDGKSKRITLSEDDLRDVSSVADLAGVLQGKLDDAFGTSEVNGETIRKVTVSESGGALSLAASGGATVSVEGAQSLGFSPTASGNLDTSKMLGKLGYAAGANGYNLTINGKTLNFGADATLDDVMRTINSDDDINVKVSYSKMTNSFQLVSKETGTAGKIEIKGGEDNLAVKLFGTVEKTGQDAVLDMEVNGHSLTNVTRSSNSFEVDGMTIKLSGTFKADAEDEEVSFSTTSDTDKILNAIKSMVDDFNAMANEIKDAYTTKPLYNSSGKRYEPLTDEDSADMSEEAIKKYEEKAKTGLLFADSNLSSLYSELRDAIGGMDLEAIGLSTEYANGKTTLKLDEDKLRGVLETDPDKVRNILTREPTNEDDLGGMMYRLNTAVERYAKTTGEKKGILIELAGSEKAVASLSENTYKGKMERVQEQIERWQNKLSDKVDYYTRQFTALEKLISQMNSQSSTIYGMMGY